MIYKEAYAMHDLTTDSEFWDKVYIESLRR
jgi:hypothetical protein